MHSETFQNILHAFWNIPEHSALEHSACILEHSGTFWNGLEYSGMVWNILEWSGTFWNCIDLHTGKEFQYGTQTDTQTLGLVELRLRS